MSTTIDRTLLGQYGRWASDLLQDPPALSFRRPEFTSLSSWRGRAKEKTLELIAAPAVTAPPKSTTLDAYERDGLYIEELELAYTSGPPAAAVFIRPAGAHGPLPGALAFHDHGGKKWFGIEKICDTRKVTHPIIAEHRDRLYGGRAWANELARRGFAVLAADVMPFGSRRLRPEAVSAVTAPRFAGDAAYEHDTWSDADIAQYDAWAAAYETVVAKSLTSAGTTWPGVALADDLQALEYLLGRKEVEPTRVACLGLSGGGLRTVFLGGLDDRIAAAVPVGFMSTWRDYVLSTSYTHTWMLYVPLLSRYLDFPEIFGLRAPRPSFVQCNAQDPLFTLSEAERAVKILAEVFEKAGAPDQFRAEFYPGPHKFDVPMQEDAFAWLTKQLG